MTNLQVTSCFSSKFRNKTRMPTMTILFNIVFEVLGTAIRQEKKINGIQILEKEVKLSLSEDDMILYIEILKTPQEKLLELI